MNARALNGNLFYYAMICKSMPENYVKIADVEVGGSEPLEALIERAKSLYLWKFEARQAKKTEEDVDLEKIFDESPQPQPRVPKKNDKKEFFSV